jgi:hypothetical protein
MRRIVQSRAPGLQSQQYSALSCFGRGKIYLIPKLGDLKPRTVLLPILLLDSFRHLGLMFLAPGATYPGIPSQFAYPATVGDLVAALLAMAAIPAVVKDAKGASLPLWIFKLRGDVRSSRSDRTGYKLRGRDLYGSSLLDTGLLGPCFAGNPLHHLHRSS